MKIWNLTKSQKIWNRIKSRICDLTRSTARQNLPLLELWWKPPPPPNLWHRKKTKLSRVNDTVIIFPVALSGLPGCFLSHFLFEPFPYGQYHAQKKKRKIQKRAVVLSKWLWSKNLKDKVIIFFHFSTVLLTNFCHLCQCKRVTWILSFLQVFCQ